MDREVPVVLKLYELTLWTMNHTAQFPRHHRYSLGTRIEATLLDLLDLLIAARYRRDNRASLDNANIMLERLRLELNLDCAPRSCRHLASARQGAGQIGQRRLQDGP